MTGLLEKHFHAENRDGEPWERSHKKLAWLGWFVVLSLVVCSCSPSRMVTNMAANAIAEGSGRSFASDDDPELVAEAMPFALKLQESLLEKSPRNEKLLLATGKGFVAYAHLFVREPADRLPKDDYQKIERLRKRYPWSAIPVVATTDPLIQTLYEYFPWAPRSVEAYKRAYEIAQRILSSEVIT